MDADAPLSSGAAAPPRRRPDAARRRAWAAFVARFCLLFFPVYFGGAAFGRWSGPPRVVAFEAEMAIPLVPAMILPYFALYPLFLLPAFALTAEAMARLSRQATAALIAAFPVFALAPTRVGYPRAEIAEPWAALYRLLAAVDAPVNAVPSLHVTFAALILFAVAEGARASRRALCALVFLVVAAATVLTHQHHLADVAAGLALALLVRRVWPLRAAP